jgi:predicted urease superfamily metal-dependent hydrolase
MLTTDYNKQAEDFLKATGTTFKSIYKSHDYYFPEDKETRDIYRITLKNSKHKYSFNFGQSIANTGIHPTPYSVLACLQKYEPGTFENFCSDYGYDVDSRKAYKTYKAVMKEFKNIELLFTAEEIEQLQEIN